MMLGHHTLEIDDILVVELSHDARFGEKVQTCFLRGTLFQRFDSHGDIFHQLQFAQPTSAHVAEFSFKKDKHKTPYTCL